MRIIGQRIVVVLHEEAADLPVKIAERREAIHPRPMVAREVRVDRVDRAMVVVNRIAGIDEKVGSEREHRGVNRETVRPVPLTVFLTGHHRESGRRLGLFRGRGDKAAVRGAQHRGFDALAGLNDDLVAGGGRQAG